MPGSGDIIVKRKNFCLHHINYNWPLSNTGLNYMGTLYTDFFIQLALCIPGFTSVDSAN